MAGLHFSLDALEEHPTPDHLRTAHAMGLLDDSLWRRLSSSRLRYDLDAAPDGTVLFAGEPAVTLEGPLVDVLLAASVLKPRLLRTSTVATRTALLARRLPDNLLIDDTSREAFDAESALVYAHAAFVGGASATTLISGGQRLGIPLYTAADPSYDIGNLRPDLLQEGDSAAESTPTILSALNNASSELAADQTGHPTLLRHLDHSLGVDLSFELVALARDGAWAPVLGWHTDPRVHPGRKTPVRYENSQGAPVIDVLHLANERIQSGPSVTAFGVNNVAAPVNIRVEKSTLLLSAHVRDGRHVAMAEPADTCRARALRALGNLETGVISGRSGFMVGLSPGLMNRKTELLSTFVHKPG